tara:strand:- start:3606 stop:4049 length:444 start_codon:yes stop_codon:yes gene_type:complete
MVGLLRRADLPHGLLKGFALPLQHFNLSPLERDILGFLWFASHLVVLLQTGYFYPKRWTTWHIRGWRFFSTRGPCFKLIKWTLFGQGSDQKENCHAMPCRSDPASSGRRTRSGRPRRQLRPSNSAETCAGDILITPSCALSQKNVTP